MTSSESEEFSSFLSRLKFRVVQPVDIPRCYQLECAAYPPEVACSKSTLQHMQHHAAPFFRCVLLKKSNEGGNDEKREVKALALLDESESEACHHVHHSPHNELIGYVCGTRCHDVATTEFKVSADADAPGEESSKLSEKEQPYPYQMKHQPGGRFLAIHSIVVQKEYQRLGVARALLENYIKSIEIYNAELDEAGINRRRNNIKAKKRDTKIERVILLSKSSMVNFFLPVGFQWRATVKNGEDPLYEMERKVESSPSHHSMLTDLQPHPLMEQECFLVDAFTNPRKWGSGNPAAVIVLQGSPTELIADYCNNADSGQLHRSFISNGSEIQEEEEPAEMRAQAWMRSVAKEFNQPATAFVWPIVIDERENSLGKQDPQDSSSISDDEESSNGPETQSETHYFIRFYTGAGIEVNMCSHATLAAASVLFCWYAKASFAGKERTVLSFHSRKDISLQASLVPPTVLEESYPSPPSSPPPQALPHENQSPRLVTQEVTPCMQNNGVRVAMDYPWRTVEPVPPGPEGQGAVLAMLRRAFFRAWSVAAPDENDNDNDTDELAFSLSLHHVTFMGVTTDREDLLVELSLEGFDMLCGRSVDYDALKQGWNGYTIGVIICCEVPETMDANAASEDVWNGDDRQELSEEVRIDFRSRYFEPKFRSEDPVSGWPHCALGPYFGGRQGKQRVLGLQSSDRGGLVECILKESEQKVCIVGATVTTLTGKTLMRA